MHITISDEEALNITRSVLYEKLQEHEWEDETHDVEIEINAINKVLDIIGR